MMPFLMEAPEDSLPAGLGAWRKTIASICAQSTVRAGVGYVTIDEAIVPAGETHRRPGLHVDGAGSWGGGGGYAANGMFQLVNIPGCRAWRQVFEGAPGPDGDCEHLRAQLRGECEMKLWAGVLWWCSPMAVHEALPMLFAAPRQFLRVSMPSSAPWHSDCTPNPLGVQPGGPIVGPRPTQMGYRSGSSKAVAA